MYVVFWRKGLPRPDLDFRPASWCSSCETVVRARQAWKPASRGSARQRIFEWGRYGANYLYRCPNEDCGQPVAPAVVGARAAIDFSLPIERIGDRTHKNGKPKPLAPNTRKRIRVGWENIGRRAPVQVQVGGNLFERDGYARVWSVDDPMRTVCGTPATALVTADRAGNGQSSPDEPTPGLTSRAQLGLVTPAGGQEANARSMDEPMHAVIGNDRLAMVVRAGGQAPADRSAEEPLNTVTAHDRQIGLVLQNMENNVPRSTDTPAPPVTTGGNQMLVQVNRGDKGDTPRPPRSVKEPMRTVAGHGELGLVEFRGEHGTVREGDRPMHTVTAQGTHHGMLVYNGVPGFVRSLDDAAGTITARDKQSLLVPDYRCVAQETDAPMGAAAHDREALVITEDDIDDCYFRMLQWPELLRAQMMHQRVDGAPYELTARRRNKRGKYVELSNELRTKMIGNAVSAPVATMLGRAVVEALR